MDTNEALKARARTLISSGISQKAFAQAMGWSEGTFSKWLNDKPGVKPPRVDQVDGMERFLKKLEQDLHATKETQGATPDAAAPGNGFQSGDPETRKTG